jgi:predicted negative regulator of RcsB-dependent stress response
MPLSTILILGYIVAFFSSFIVAIGGIATWQVVSDLREQAASRRSARYTEYQGALKAA